MKVYAIPGLGTNYLIFNDLKIYKYELVSLNWPPLKKEYTMADYARCFIDQINTSEPFVLLGLSFGGMLAVELGKILKPEKIILISSAKTRNGLSGAIRFLKFLPIHNVIPDKAYRYISYKAKYLLGFLMDYMKILSKMGKDLPENYFKYSVGYIINWNNTVIPKNTFLIHGTSDRLIWFNKKQVDYVVKAGSHAMIITKAKEVSKIVNEILEIN